MTTTAPAPTVTHPLDTFSVAAWQHRALVVGGVLFAVGNALHPLEHSDAAYRSATWEAAHLVILASVPLLVLGLPLLHAPLRAHLPGRVVAPILAALTVGLIGLAPGMVIEAYVAPSIGFDAMDALETGAMGTVNGLFGVGYLGGTLALAWAVRRARLWPRAVVPVMLVATLALVVSMGLTGPGAGVVIIAGTVAQGLALSVLGLRAPRP